MKKKRNRGLAIFFFVLTAGLWIFWTNTQIQKSHFQIKSKKLASDFDGFKIAQLSDLHNHDWKGQLIEKIKEEKPDLIVITGDLVDSRNTDIELAISVIQKAKEIAPIYYVSGNHEARLGKDYLLLKEGLKANSVEILDNDSTFIEIGESKIQLVGLKDPDFSNKSTAKDIQANIIQEELDKLLEEDFFTIVLSHRPEHFEEYVDAAADLVLTGHAHGGQVRIPFIGGLIAPNQGLFPDYSEGISEEKETKMIVSRGLGNSIIPVRINNHPELIIIELKSS